MPGSWAAREYISVCCARGNGRPRPAPKAPGGWRGRSATQRRRPGAQGRLHDLAALTELSEDTLSDGMRGGAAFHDWLLNTAIEDALVEDFLLSMDDFSQGTVLPSALLSAEEAAGDAIDDAATQYRGTAGLRKAVLRFLSGAVRNGVEELCLYSDQTTDWMTSNPAFTQKWAALMVSCVRAGMQIRVIHPVRRVGERPDTVP